jgi:hypothetical protein
MDLFLVAKYHRHRLGIRWRKVEEIGKENGDGVPMTMTITALPKAERA